MTWESVNDKGRWLINVVVNGPTDQAVSLEVEGRKVERVKDLISGETFVGPPSFHLHGSASRYCSSEALTVTHGSVTLYTHCVPWHAGAQRIDRSSLNFSSRLFTFSITTAHD